MLAHMVPALGVIWHFWIAVSLLVPAVLLVVGTVILYVVKVEMPRYRREDQPTPQEFEALEARKS
jgi:hypothetical protein